MVHNYVAILFCNSLFLVFVFTYWTRLRTVFFCNHWRGYTGYNERLLKCFKIKPVTKTQMFFNCYHWKHLLKLSQIIFSTDTSTQLTNCSLEDWIQSLMPSLYSGEKWISNFKVSNKVFQCSIYNYCFEFLKKKQNM